MLGWTSPLTWVNGQIIRIPRLLRELRNNPNALKQRLEAVGSIVETFQATAPDGYLLCNGQVVSRTTYAALFAVIGTAFNTGGETSAQFRLPDFRGRFAVGPSGSIALASRGGNGSHEMEISQLPAHRHTIGPHAHGLTSQTVSVDSEPGGNTILGPAVEEFAAGTVSTSAASASVTAATGGGGAFSIEQRWRAVNRIIRYQ